MNVIKRNLLEEIRKHLSKKEITLIIGPRQVGKTTLMLKLKDYLEKKVKKLYFSKFYLELS